MLVIDSKTGLSHWFRCISGNILNLITIMIVIIDVKRSLSISIQALSKMRLCLERAHEKLCDNRRTLLVKMHLRQGWPSRVLYHKQHDKFSCGRYAFVRTGHEYFGIHDIGDLFRKKMHFYIYVDHNNAVTAARKYIMKTLRSSRILKRSWRAAPGISKCSTGAWESFTSLSQNGS